MRALHNSYGWKDKKTTSNPTPDARWWQALLSRQRTVREKRTKDSFSQMSSWSVNWCSEPKSQESWGLTSSSDALYFYKTQMLNVLKLGPWIHPAEVWNQKCQNFHKKTSQDSVEKCLNQGLMLVMTSVEIWGHNLFEPESVETYLFLALLPVGPGFFF